MGRGYGLMRATQFLREYEDLGQEKQNIIQTISGLDANTPEQAALLDRIWKLLNSETFGSTFTFNNPKAKSQCGCGTSFSI